jgi:phospholipid transport system transporter-binding protein
VNNKKQTKKTFAQLRIENTTAYIEGVLDFDTVLELLPQLRNAILSMAVANVDLTSVSYSNSAGVALLLDAVREAKKNHKVITLHNIPKDMSDLIRISGLQDVLKIGL